MLTSKLKACLNFWKQSTNSSCPGGLARSVSTPSERHTRILGSFSNLYSSDSTEPDNQLWIKSSEIQSSNYLMKPPACTALTKTSFPLESPALWVKDLAAGGCRVGNKTQCLPPGPFFLPFLDFFLLESSLKASAAFWSRVTKCSISSRTWFRICCNSEKQMNDHIPRSGWVGFTNSLLQSYFDVLVILTHEPQVFIF